MKIVMSGASGLIGSTTSKLLERRGHTVVRLTRSRPKAGQIQWQPQTLTLEQSILPPDTDAIVHLAGENIFGRWSDRKMREIRDSRVISTALLAGMAAGMENPPKVFLCASAVGYYGNRGDEILTEESSSGDGFLPDVARRWEAALDPATKCGIRTVALRLGVVLSSRGGALAKMLPSFKLGFGGPVGSGTQYMSWVALDDVAEIICEALENERYSGAFNVTSPEPVTNEVFTKALGKQLGKKANFRVPSLLLRTVFADMADEALLGSTRAVPAKLQELGFKFSYPTLEGALRHCLAE